MTIAKPQPKQPKISRYFILGLVIVLSLVIVYLLISINHKQKAIGLHVGSQKNSLKILLEASGELKNLPYPIEFASFPSAGQTAQALSSHAIDIGVLGDASLAFALAGHAPLKVISVVRTRVTPTAVAVVVNKNSPLQKPEDLIGKRITTTKGSVGHYLALAVLDQLGHSGRDVEFIFLQPGEARTLLSNGGADAWSTWDPYTSMAELEGNVRVIASGEKLFAGNIMLTANQQAIDTKRAQLADFIQRVTHAYQWANQHQEEFAKLQAKATGLPVRVHYLSNTHGHPHVIAIDQGVIDDMQTSINLYVKEGLLPQSIISKSIFDPSFNHTQSEQSK
ncbi:aliphatic sulfonate ABC transporter substrate-binding protein [Aquirhabdus parva]|uniref:Putative aliphatic sulfonates-binding protein n=1 Tax=Aquirhabdus parva TaxID=2283318 RepID=A0A345P5M4_9GAMM|nr:aliphatic sulfonate ABC transporter substrate-binding protein [Aquirhabdus parva]AXI02583.1 aliphatic sulfonate ABC transporter substrate-binding protein [Aquirhabdus parva]